MKKKAQGVSINTIIIAAIALVVLVVLIAVFTGRMGNFGIGLDSATKTCAQLGGEWEDANNCESDILSGATDQAANIGKKCCKS